MDLKTALARAAVFVAIMLIWQILPTYKIITPVALAPLSKVIAIFPQAVSAQNPDIPYGSLPLNFLLTLGEIALGFALSAAIGLTIGLVIGYYRIIGRAYEPLVYVAFAIPGIIVYPGIYSVLGYGFISKVVFAVFLGVFPLIINTAAGMR